MKHYYRHFKGGKYELVAVGYDSENPDRLLIVYKALYGEHKVWVRPYEMFFGDVEVNGELIKRFVEISRDEAFD